MRSTLRERMKSTEREREKSTPRVRVREKRDDSFSEASDAHSDTRIKAGGNFYV